jgi:hypothetical protein
MRNRCRLFILISAFAFATANAQSISSLCITETLQGSFSLPNWTPSLETPPNLFDHPPTAHRTPQYPWKMKITATVFWVGEAASGNNLTPNTGSSWDPNWAANYGGYDDPDSMRRTRDYRPAGFVPKQNPFYVALPYNDCWDCTATKAEAARVVPWFKAAFKKCGRSVCRDRWIAIRCGSRICYAQWSDCGPFATDDAAYVFGDSPPASSHNGGAGIDLSPAVRDFLGFKSGGKCDWRFVDREEVPDGPWRQLGRNNPFSKDWQEEPETGSANYVAAARDPKPSGTRKVAETVIRGSAKMPGLRLKSTAR